MKIIEEENIRKLNEDFNKIKTLSKILDDKAFNGTFQFIFWKLFFEFF